MYGRGISFVSQRWESQGRASFAVPTPGGRGQQRGSRPGIRPRSTTMTIANHARAAVGAHDPMTMGHIDLFAFLKPFRRWYRRKRHALYLTMLVFELVYNFATIPLRVAFFFDPYGSDRDKGWTNALTIYTTFDLLTEISSIASVREIFNARRRALAAFALDAGNVHVNPRNRRHQRGRAAVNEKEEPQPSKKSSLVVAWSLNTLVPSSKEQYNIRRPLLYEAIAIVPIELLAIALGPNWLHMLRMLKVFRLHRVRGCLKELKKLHARRPMVQLLDFTGNALLFKRVLSGLALCHWIACAYMALAHWECGLSFKLCTRGVDQNNHTITNPRRFTCWAIEDQLVGASPLRKYARAVYWSARTLITVGYYDVTPVTDLETAFGIVIQIVGAVFSTSLIATFLFVFRYLNARKQAFMTHVDEAKEYMKMSHIPDDVNESVISFYRNVWQAHNGLSQDEVTSRLPEHLRVGVLKVLVAQRIHAVAFLAKESEEFINTLALKVELCVYSPKDWIIEKVPDGMFFVLRGNVMLEIVGQTQPRHVKAGEHFAEFALLLAGKSDERARATTYSELYKLSQSWFRETLDLFYGAVGGQKQLESMRAMLNRRDQQQQKMKRLFGRSVGDFQRSVSSRGELGTRRNTHLSWFLPGSGFRRWWEHFRLLALTFVAYEVPFFIVFDTAEFPFMETPIINIQSITSVMVEVFFTVDFVLRSWYFAYIDSMSMIPVTDSTYIFQHYKDNGMLIDLISIIPVATILEFMYGAQWMLIVPAFRLLRILRLRHLASSIQEISHVRRLSSQVQTAITLVISVTLTIHVTGCFWFLMARLGMSEQDFQEENAHTLTRPDCLRFATLHGNCSWALFDAYGQVGHGFPFLSKTELASNSSTMSASHRRLSSAPGSASLPTESSYTSKFAYLRSIYWAIAALTTVGYGDIVAFSTEESFFAALWVFFGGIINYAVVAAMSNIISNLTAASRHHMEKMNLMNTVLAHYGISDEVRHQVRRFYYQQYYIQRVASEAKLLARLPQQLRHRISLTLHAESITKLSLFVDFGHERLLHDLTGLFRRGVYQRGDVLVQDSTICDEILVVVSGRGNIFCRRTAFAAPVGAFGPGSCCGVSEMLLRVKSPTFAIATTVVEVSAISYQAYQVSIEGRYPNEATALEAKALEYYEAEARALDAIADNMKKCDKLRRCIDRCTSMFAETRELTSAQQHRKSQTRFYWDILITLVNTYFAFQITFRVPFLKTLRGSGKYLLVMTDVVGDFLLATDIVLKLYYFECDEGFQNILSRAEKNANYAHHYLKQDLWSMLPLYYVGENFFWMSVLRLPRLIRIRQIPGAIDSLIVRIQQRVTAVEDVSAYLAPVKLLLILLFAAHTCACVFYWISTMDENANSWIHHDHVVHEAHNSIPVLYLRGYYWALTTLTLVGSREIVPLDVPGTLFASLTCLCCTFVVGHIVGELSDMILEMDKAKKELHERESSFEQFAKDHNLPASVRTRVVHYLKFQHHHCKGLDIYETFHDLSRNLKTLLMMDLYGKSLRGLCIAPFLSEGLLRGLATRLKSELYIPGDNIIVEGDPGHKLFILKKGSAMVMWKSTGTAVATLKEGTIFGEVAFFLKGSKRIASVQATFSIELLVVDRRSWDTLMNSCELEERKLTEQTLVNWVKECLKGYNVMTVEIVKDIKSANQLAKPSNGLENHAPGALEERTLRLLLRQGSKKGLEVARSMNSGGSARSGLSAPLGSMFANRNLQKVYASSGFGADINGKKRALVTPAKTNPRRPSQRLLRLPLPLLKSSSMKNGTMQQLYPLAKDLKDLYTKRQLRDMEDECWRRYKVSILMSDTIVTRDTTMPRLPVAEASRTDSILASSILAAKAIVVDRNRRISALGMRKGSQAPLNPHRIVQRENPRSSLNSSRHDGVTTDGMRFLANYRIVDIPIAAMVPQHKNHIQPQRTHDKGKSRAISDAEDLTARHVVQRRRMLKRTQSLPIFDHHFADIVREELKASNIKDYASKLHLGFEVMRRARQTEFSYLFKAYKWWQGVKKAWASSTWASQLIVTSRDKRASVSRGYTRRFSTLSLSGMHRESTGRSGEVGPVLTAAQDEGEIFFNLLSRWYRIWECFVVLNAMLYAISLPYFVAFCSRTRTETWSRGLKHWIAFACLMDVFCLVDLVLKYTTFQGVMEMNNEKFNEASPRVPVDTPKKLRVSGYFVLDMFAALPFDLLLFLPPLHPMTHSLWYYLALFQFNKIFRIYQAKEASERLAQFMAYDLNLPVHDRTLRFIRSVGAYLLAGHWIACFWFRTSLHAYEHSPTSWLSTQHMLAMDEFTTLADIPDIRRYLRAAHFAAGSITTVFYGDIASSNILETVAEIGVILLSIFVFGMVVGAHSEHLESKYKHRMQFEQNLTELYYYLKNNDVPQSVRHRLKTYYMNTWLRFHGHDDFEGVQGLSTLLVEDIAQLTLRKFASKVSILKACDECFLRALLTCLKNVICSPNEPVVRKGDVDRSMYFIARGKIIVEGKGFQLVKEEGDFFGELSLLYGIPRSATCSSLGTSLLYVLEWHAYEALLKDYPEYRHVNRREWVIVSTVLQAGESRFRSIIDLVSRMDSTSWIQIDAIIKKAKSLK